MQIIRACGLAQRLRIIKRIAQIVSDLEGLTDARAQLEPRLGLLSGSHRPHLGRGNKQGSGLGLMIGRQIILRLALPSLTRADTTGHARALRQDHDKLRHTVGGDTRLPRKYLKGQHDQTVTGQNRQRLRIGLVHRRLAAPHVRIVKTGQVVVDKARAMDQLQRRGRRIRQPRPVVPACHRHRRQYRGPDPRTPRCRGISQRG